MVSAAIENEQGWAPEEYIVGVRGIVSGGTTGIHGSSDTNSDDMAARGTPIGRQARLVRRNDQGMLEECVREETE